MKKIVIPCSGIGKTFGTVSREAANRLTEEMYSSEYRTVCLPLLMTDNDEVKHIVQNNEIYTIDGCPSKCASTLVKHVGGDPKMETVVTRVLAKNRTHKPNSVLDIGDGGRLLVEDVVDTIIKNKDGENKSEVQG